MYRNLSYPTLLRLSHLHCHVKLTGVQTVQSKVPSKAKVKQSKLFVFASPLSYQYETIYLSKLLLFFPTTLFIAFRFTPLKKLEKQRIGKTSMFTANETQHSLGRFI